MLTDTTTDNLNEIYKLEINTETLQSASSGVDIVTSTFPNDIIEFNVETISIYTTTSSDKPLESEDFISVAPTTKRTLISDTDFSGDGPLETEPEATDTPILEPINRVAPSDDNNLSSVRIVPESNISIAQEFEEYENTKIANTLPVTNAGQVNLIEATTYITNGATKGNDVSVFTEDSSVTQLSTNVGKHGDATTTETNIAQYTTDAGAANFNESNPVIEKLEPLVQGEARLVETKDGKNDIRVGTTTEYFDGEPTTYIERIDSTDGARHEIGTNSKQETFSTFELVPDTSTVPAFIPITETEPSRIKEKDGTNIEGPLTIKSVEMNKTQLDDGKFTLSTSELPLEGFTGNQLEDTNHSTKSEVIMTTDSSTSEQNRSSITTQRLLENTQQQIHDSNGKKFLTEATTITPTSPLADFSSKIGLTTSSNSINLGGKTDSEESPTEVPSDTRPEKISNESGMITTTESDFIVKPGEALNPLNIDPTTEPNLRRHEEVKSHTEKVVVVAITSKSHHAGKPSPKETSTQSDSTETTVPINIPEGSTSAKPTFTPTQKIPTNIPEMTTIIDSESSTFVPELPSIHAPKITTTLTDEQTITTDVTTTTDHGLFETTTLLTEYEPSKNFNTANTILVPAPSLTSSSLETTTTDTQIPKSESTTSPSSPTTDIPDTTTNSSLFTLTLNSEQSVVTITPESTSPVNSTTKVTESNNSSSIDSDTSKTLNSSLSTSPEPSNATKPIPDDLCKNLNETSSQSNCTATSNQLRLQNTRNKNAIITVRTRPLRNRTTSTSSSRYSCTKNSDCPTAEICFNKICTLKKDAQLTKSGLMLAETSDFLRGITTVLSLLFL